jgi:hypothetical protein
LLLLEHPGEYASVLPDSPGDRPSQRLLEELELLSATQYLLSLTIVFDEASLKRKQHACKQIVTYAPQRIFTFIIGVSDILL